MTLLRVAATDLRRRIRNRSALVTAFVGPLALAVVFGVLVGGAGSSGFDIGVVNADNSHLARSLAAQITGTRNRGGSTVRFTRVATAADARRRVDDGGLDAAVVIPAGFEAATARGSVRPMVVLQAPDRLVGGQVAQAVALEIGDDISRVLLSVKVTAAAGRPPGPRVIAAARAQPPAFRLVRAPLGGRELSAPAFYGASMSIVFLFFTIAYAARSVLAERRDGTLARILATPARASSVLAGKTLSVATLGLAGLVTVWAVTTLAFGASWGAPVAVLLVMVATVFAIGGVSLLIASLAQTEQQADAYTSVVTFGLALVGGNFIGPGQMPPLLRTLSLATPNGWALRLHRSQRGCGRRTDDRHRPRGARDVRLRDGDGGPCPRVPGDASMSARASLAFTAVVLRRLLRDPVSLFFMIVLPVIVIVVVGATFGGQGRLDLGIVRGNGGPYAARVARALRAGDGITVHIYRTVAEMRQAARRETIAGGIVLGPRFEQAVRMGATARIPFVASPAADQAFSAEVTLRGALAPLADRVTAARVATDQTGKPLPATFVLADRLGGTAPPSVRVRFVGHASAAVLSRFSRTAPQNLVLFVFITSLSSAALIVQARRQGVLRRALATRTGMGTILLGLGLGWFSIALVQSAIILFVGGVLFGVDWGSPVPAALLVVDFALLGCGAGLLLGALGRDEDRVSSIAPILGLVLGALGGCMVPLEVFPPGMITLAHVVPQYWAVRSWQSLIFDGAGVSTIATALAVLAAYAAVLTAAAVFLLRRSLTR